MSQVARISVGETHKEVTSGRALLVCAYEKEETCNQVALEGSLSHTRFQERAATLPCNQEVIFFCA